MSVRSICLVTGLFSLVGCGTATEPHSGSVANSTQPTVKQENADNPSGQQTSPSQPPGTMQLPADAVIPAPKPSIAESADPKSGGFELPPLDATSAQTEPSKPNQTVTAQRPVIDGPQSASVTLQTGTVEQALQFAHDAGKVCVVDFWSLSCGPCLKEFPAWWLCTKSLATSLPVCPSTVILTVENQSQPRSIVSGRKRSSMLTVLSSKIFFAPPPAKMCLPSSKPSQFPSC